MDPNERPPMTPQRRRWLTVYSGALTVGIVVTALDGWLPMQTAVVGVVLVIVGLGFVHERPWAIRFGAWATEREERNRANPRPTWQRVAFIAAVVIVVALLLSANGF